MPRRKNRESVRAMLLKKSLAPALVTAIVIVILYGLLGIVKSDFLYTMNYSLILFAAFGSSAFLMFMAPHSRMSSVGRFVKSYLIASVIGALGYFLLSYIPFYLVAGIAVFFASVLLYVTDNVHAPAMGIMLAFILFRIDVEGALIVIIGVFLLAVMRILLERYLYRIDRDLERIYESG